MRQDFDHVLQPVRIGLDIVAEESANGTLPQAHRSNIRNLQEVVDTMVARLGTTTQ
ncbi:hypothetical protein N7453_011115 [Penicillium expansum]|nr:hypothetical protein N7453_011115 [Penicillium expansum]